MGGNVKVELAEDEGVGADSLLGGNDVLASMFNHHDLILPEGFFNSDDTGN